ncbi:hypothetical protein CKO40_08545 [Halochromatium glycolicum]|uniref:Uncharacterized protein n=1 Tax=Halochromatium glycolicum TaxID=85075 RepID=A0AAJ0X9Z3_9GAMM|nr:hypothetical protein [Halochromatium glycolicum]
MIVRLTTTQPEYPDLSANQPYFVIGIEADDFRILNDSGKPYLYPAAFFEVIDSQQPADWLTEFGDDGERYAYPAALNAPGFFEDFFDQKPEQTAIFWHELNKVLSQAA